MKDMERLSEVIIDTLKTLSSRRQALTPSSLGDALASRGEVFELFASLARPGTTGRDSGAGVQRLREREQKLLKDIAALEESASKERDFHKRALLGLVTLARAREHGDLASSLDHFRSLVVKDASLEQKEACLKELKDLVVKAGEDGPGKDRGKPAQERVTAAPPTPKVKELTPNGRRYVPRLQNVLMSILDQFDTPTVRIDSVHASDLRKRINASRDMETVISLADDVLMLIKSYIEQTIDARIQVAHFVKDLGRNVLEMEKHFVSSAADSREAYRESEGFHATLQVQMEEIKDSFALGKTLEETRSLVLARLKTIRTSLEYKSKQDEIRFQKAQSKLEELQKSLNAMKSEIAKAEERTKILQKEVLHDILTGIHNRRAYEQRIQEELERFSRHGQSFSLVLFDVDHFKRVNDQYGHRAGDKCLKEIIKIIQPCIRDTDFLARYGGEEFVLVLPGTAREAASKKAETIRQLIESTRFLYQKDEIPITLSVGVTQVDAGDTDPGALFERVDAAMYRAKRGGRNRVCVL